MKMSRLVSIALLGVALAVTPVYAQRGGGGRSGGGSVSSSRGGGGYSSSRSSGGGFSSSRSSSSHSSSSSRSSSSYSGSRSSNYSSPSRSSSSISNTPSRSSSSSDAYRGSSRSSSESGYSRSGNQMRSRSGSIPEQIRSRSGQPQRVGERGSTGNNRGSRNGRGLTTGDRGPSNVGNGRPGGVAPTPEGGYARPGHPGHMPPSSRPMHPAPYFMHPHHHCLVHCHPLFWDPFPPRPYFWPGFWLYCNSYWYDYHVTDVVVVKEYVRETYGMDMITYAISGDYMYALVNDPDGHTYLQIYDQNDKLLAEQQVSRKYCKMQVDPENGGCWIMKKRDKDPLLFFYTAEGQLLIYEADK